MSSNMYGFTCDFTWEGRSGSCQIVYVGTGDDDPDTLDFATRDWETTEPAELARYELKHRDFSNKYYSAIRIECWVCYMCWNEDDPSDISWKPPMPTEKQLLELIADEAVINIQHGWDT